MSCQVRVEVFWSGAERRAAQADALGFEMEAPARANTRKVKIHTRTHAPTRTHIVYSVISGIAHSVGSGNQLEPQEVPVPGQERVWHGGRLYSQACRLKKQDIMC